MDHTTQDESTLDPVEEKGAGVVSQHVVPSEPSAVSASSLTGSGAASTQQTATQPAASAKNADLDGVLQLVDTGKLSSQEIEILRGFVKEYSVLKVKVDRLKGLLGRSAKAQREAKVELEATQKRLDVALQDAKRLKSKVDHLSSRPTHMDLLNDFETNFDRALLSVGQTGGQDTAPQLPAMVDTRESAVDAMLMQELEETRHRLAKLESLNSALVQRAAQLEADAKQRKDERDEAMRKLSHVELELRMSRMEAAHAQRAAEEKAASLEEMQMEIDLVTKASMKASVLAAQGQAVAKSSKTDRQHVVQLEAQVQALKEWALAAGESKRLALERVSLLEQKLKNQGGELDTAHSSGSAGKTIFSKSGSLVVGAGDVGEFVIALEEQSPPNARLVLMWKFDATPTDCTVDFSVRKGKCLTAKESVAGTYLIKERPVTGGAAGELEGAFQDDNHCTLLWSNRKSWIRPRTIKYTLQVVRYDA